MDLSVQFETSSPVQVNLFGAILCKAVYRYTNSA